MPDLKGTFEQGGFADHQEMSRCARAVHPGSFAKSGRGGRRPFGFLLITILITVNLEMLGDLNGNRGIEN